MTEISGGGLAWVFMTAALAFAASSGLALRRAIREKSARRWGGLALGLFLLAAALAVLGLNGPNGAVGYLALGGATLLVLSPFPLGRR